MSRLMSRLDLPSTEETELWTLDRELRLNFKDLSMISKEHPLREDKDEMHEVCNFHFN